MEKVLFLDLDLTIIQTKSGQIHSKNINDFQFLPGIISALQKFEKYPKIIVTNQGGIESGYITEEEFNSKMIQIQNDLKEKGISIDHYFYSKSNSRQDLFRKPNDGMALKAELKFEDGIDFAGSIMVGDKEDDKGFALNSGIGTFYFTNNFIEKFG